MNSSVELRSGLNYSKSMVIFPRQCPNNTCHVRFDMEGYEGSELTVYVQNNYFGGFIHTNSAIICKHIMFFVMCVLPDHLNKILNRELTQ